MIPLPVQIKYKNGSFAFDSRTKISCDTASEIIAQKLSDFMRKELGLNLEIVNDTNDTNLALCSSLEMRIDNFYRTEIIDYHKVNKQLKKLIADFWSVQNS